MFILRPRVLGVLLAVGMAVRLVSVAQADPHATFFTAIGQQQLFFNMLAALDQADYVEQPGDPCAAADQGTGDNNGVPCAPTRTRQEALERREAAGFGPESDPAVTATQSGLGNILTRGVTLEGHDLWTAYLTHQFAIEVARRRGLKDVLDIYCERGLGRPDCGSQIDINRVKQAYVFDPLRYAKAAFTNGVLGILLSGDDSGLRERVLATDNDEDADLPVPFSETVEEAKSAAGQAGDFVNQAHNLLLLQAAHVFLPPTLSSSTFDNLTVGNDGRVGLAYSIEGGGGPIGNTAYAQEPSISADQHLSLTTQTLQEIITMNSRALGEFEEGVNRTELQTSGRVVDGIVPDTKQVGERDTNGNPEEIRLYNRNPAAAQDEIVRVAARAPAEAEQTLQYASTSQAKQPGTQYATDDARGSSSQVRGATTNQNGQVLGLNSEDPNEVLANRQSLSSVQRPLSYEEGFVPAHEDFADVLLAVVGAADRSPRGTAGYNIGALRSIRPGIDQVLEQLIGGNTNPLAPLVDS